MRLPRQASSVVREFVEGRYGAVDCPSSPAGVRPLGGNGGGSRETCRRVCVVGTGLCASSSSAGRGVCYTSETARPSYSDKCSAYGMSGYWCRCCRPSDGGGGGGPSK